MRRMPPEPAIRSANTMDAPFADWSTALSLFDRQPVPFGQPNGAGHRRRCGSPHGLVHPHLARSIAEGQKQSHHLYWAGRRQGFVDVFRAQELPRSATMSKADFICGTSKVDTWAVAKASRCKRQGAPIRPGMTDRLW